MSLLMLTARLVYVQFIFQEDVHEDILCELLVGNQHHGCRSTQVFESLQIRKTELVILCINICTGRVAAVTVWISLLLNVGLCTVVWQRNASQKCHLNLTMYCRMWLKSGTNWIHALNSSIHMVLWGDAEREHTSSFIHRSEKAECRSQASISEFWELLQRFFFLKRKTVTTASTFQCHRMGHKTALLIWHTQSALMNSICHFEKNDNCVEVGKEAAFKAQLELQGQLMNILMLQTLAEVLKETESGPSFLQLVHNHPCQLSQEFGALFPNHRRPLELGRNGSRISLE